MDTWILAMASSLVAIIAVLTPLFVKIIENRHTMKLKQLELFYSRKQDLYMSFSKAYSDIFLNGKFSDALELFSSIAYQATMLCDEDISKDIQNLIQKIINDRHNSGALFFLCQKKLKNDLFLTKFTE